METYSLIKSIRLHLLPGLLVIGLYVVLAPVLNNYGYPSLLALLLAAFLGIVPLELGHLLLKGHHLNGRISLKGVVGPTERIPAVKFILLLLGALLALILIGGISFTVEASIKSTLFSWLPHWYFFDTNFESYSRESLILTAWVRLALDGIVFPVTEELYFRGFLFDRLPGTLRNKWLSGAILFAVYHFWQPWNYLSIFFISIVLIWPLAKFRNVYLSIAIHMAANIIGALLFFGQILQRS